MAAAPVQHKHKCNSSAGEQFAAIPDSQLKPTLLMHVYRSPESRVFSPLFPALIRKTHSAASLPKLMDLFSPFLRGKQPCMRRSQRARTSPEREDGVSDIRQKAGS